MKAGIVFILLFLSALAIQAQILRKENLDIEQFIESLFPIQDEDINYEDIYEQLLQYYLNPINLNTGTGEELRSLYVLGPIEINNLLSYRENFGPLLSIYELQAVPGFTLEAIERLLPFVTLEEKASDEGSLLNRIINSQNRYLIVRYERTLETKRGYTPPDTLSGGRLSSRYAGDPNKIYTRFRSSRAGDYSIGFTAEKDQGETFGWNPKQKTYGFDFWSYHLVLQNKGKWQTIALGDYQMQFGQGLLLGAGFFVGKGAETITAIRRGNTGIRPYTSVLEGGYFKGAAATYKAGKFLITGFYSNARRDATLGETDGEIESAFSETFISSIRTSGFHRTQSEIDGKRKINERITGANITYKDPKGAWLAGATAMLTQYNLPLQRQDRLYNRFEFNGRQNFNSSAYYSYSFDNFNFFGEVASSSSGGIGMVNGVLAGLSSTLEAAVLHRKFDKDFHSLYAAGFSENSRNINEEGFYVGLKFTPNRKLKLAVYADRFEFPWLRFRVDAPSRGHEYLARLTYTPNRNVHLYFQAREESKARNFSSESNSLNLVLQGLKRNYMINVEFGNNENLQLRSRLQWSTYELGTSFTSGMTLVQDLNWQFGKFRLSSRLALFDTEDYDNRQYVFERDVLYAFAIPAYFGEGIRTYLLGQYKFTRNTSVWLKWARTRYFDRDIIGSGLERISGQQRNDIRLQLMTSF